MADARIAFMKLIVDNLPRAKEFYESAFGFAQTNAFDTPDFEEVMLQQDGNEFLLLLLAYKSRPCPDATTHGPTGFVCTDLDGERSQGVVRRRDPQACAQRCRSHARRVHRRSRRP